MKHSLAKSLVSIIGLILVLIEATQIRRFRLHVRVDIQRYNYIVFSVDEAGGSEVKMERYVVLKSFAKDTKWNN